MPKLSIEFIKRTLRDMMIVPHACTWTKLDGGRTNTCWHVAAPDPLVIKLYNPDAASALFDNRPDLEWLMLGFLHPFDMSPKPLHRLDIEGVNIIVYGFEQAVTEAPDFHAIGAYLAKLHQMPAPDMLPDRQATKSWISTVGAAYGLKNLPETLPRFKATLLHGDPVVANFIKTKNGLKAIDWQCPAIGNPVDDIAIALSPGMHRIYTGKMLTNRQKQQFWSGYDAPQIHQSFEETEHIYRRVIAAYLASRGTKLDRQAAEIELSTLDV